MLSAACASTGRIACPPLQPVFNEKYNQPEIKVSGGHREEVTPVPIPNTAVKLFIANDTARATVWESRTPPGYYEKPLSNQRLFAFRAACHCAVWRNPERKSVDGCHPSSRRILSIDATHVVVSQLR